MMANLIAVCKNKLLNFYPKYIEVAAPLCRCAPKRKACWDAQLFQDGDSGNTDSVAHGNICLLQQKCGSVGMVAGTDIGTIEHSLSFLKFWMLFLC